MNPLVSVVVPSYNRAYCVADTVRSVLAQTYADFEVLVVDDGSTDGTRQVIEENFASEPRVRYVGQTNQGVSAARNHGMQLGEGPTWPSWIPTTCFSPGSCSCRSPAWNDSPNWS